VLGRLPKTADLERSLPWSELIEGDQAQVDVTSARSSIRCQKLTLTPFPPLGAGSAGSQGAE